MPLYKGDKVVVNFNKFGHNVVNAISEVIQPLNGTHYQITRPEGAFPVGEGGHWVLELKAPEMVQHYPELKIGDEVFILGYPKSVAEGHIIDDQRGQKQKITLIQDDSLVRLNNWWYVRGDVTINPEAMNQAAIERQEHCYFSKPKTENKPVKIAPKTKYKVINCSTKENDNDFVSF